MTNDNKNTNELVIADDDPTIELEALADTFGFEFREREELTRDLNAKLASARDDAARSGDGHVAGRLAAALAEAQQRREQLAQAESYADELRRQLQERIEASREIAAARDSLRGHLDSSHARVSELERQVDELRAKNASLEDRLSRIRDEHEEEIRLIRFELGEAQETVAQHELVTEQLASDLVDTRGFRDELEKMLTRSEEQSETRISDLERENRRLKDELVHSRETLESKSEAINCLLAELAHKSEQLDSAVEVEEIIHEVDDNMSNRIGGRVHRDRDRISRVLIGSVDGQELRFPLFKDRLTIGRTEQNDIQLKATYVSRRHAVVVVDHDTTRVIDWGSKNGVFVNSERVTEHFLRNGDSVRIGTAEFRYEQRAKRNR